MTSRRDTLRRRLQVVRHAPPEEALVAMKEPPTSETPAVVSRETTAELPSTPYVAGGQVPGAFDVAALQEPPPSLSRAQVLRLEALTAVWERQVRESGPPDATLFYGAPTLPPVPPARRRNETVSEPTAPEPLPAAELEEPVVQPEPAPLSPAPAPVRVSDWTPNHDPRSLEYAARTRLANPVPLQDYLLDRGPILDQGTTPPLSLHDASACVGMACVAAANVLDLESRPVYVKPDPATLLDEEDARRAYARAQDLDALSGHDYAGTSVLAGMKAGQEAGWWDTYLWALGGTRDVAQCILQLRAPVVVGVPWGPSLDAPDAAGIITPAGALNAGHALAVVGLKMTVAGRPGPYFILQQSRGPLEGKAGLVYLHHTHLAGLLAGRGEAGVPLPRWGLS